MLTPLYKKLKKNGTTLYVFPSVEEDKNFEHNNDNFRMYLSHYALVKFPRQIPNSVLDFDNTFEQNPTSITPATYKDQLVESLRNYIANHESVIRNSKINNTEYYYDTMELHTNTEKIFWKWCKKLGILSFEPADNVQEYFGADSKYDDNGQVGNTDHFREYLWRERSTNAYSVDQVDFGNLPPLPPVSPNKIYLKIILTSSTNFKVGDNILLNIANIDSNPGFSTEQSLLPIIEVLTDPNGTINDTIIVEVDDNVTLVDLGNINELELYNYYERFIQFIGEVAGLNNVQLPNQAYTETFAYISNQHGQTPYCLFNIKSDSNYRPGSQWPILPQEIQAEIQGGENPNNPILTNSNKYPGDIWGQFDTNGFRYITPSGDSTRRSGDYYGVYASNNNNPTLKYPDFDGELIDGLCLNLNIDDYVKAVSYVYPINTFNEFAATAFNNEPPKDFEFNAIIWYYTVEDVSNNNLDIATNLYGVEFLDTPENDIDPLKTKIPLVKKLVSNGYQDGNSYTFSLDTNIAIDSDTDVPAFEPDKVYSLFGMSLYYEALTRLTYFNDKLTDLVATNIQLKNRVDGLAGIVYTQQDLQSIRSRMDNIENLLNVYSTLQIGDTDSIIAKLDVAVNPPLIRLHSVDKRYGNIYQYNTKNMFTEYLNINNATDYTINEKTIPVQNSKDFLVVINNNDNIIPSPPYDTTKLFEHLSIVLEKDLHYKQTLDILITPLINEDPITLTNLTNHPINDKKLDLFINYNVGNDNIQKHKLNKYDLPVLKNYDGTNVKDEPHALLNTTPIWKIEKVYYSKANTSDRVFSLLINDDLISLVGGTNPFMEELSRIYVDNFLLEQDPNVPTNTYADLSGQYSLSDNAQYKRSYVLDVEILNNGTAYTPGIQQQSFNIGTSTIEVEYVINSSGIISDVYLLNSNIITDQVSIDTAGPFLITGGTGGEIKFILNIKTIVSFKLNKTLDLDNQQMLDDYDILTDPTNTKPTNQKTDITKYFRNSPLLTLLKGTLISITRISDIDLPISQIDKRYKITTKRL
jgi:hypothetical protein